jgi:hypothetical protein
MNDIGDRRQSESRSSYKPRECYNPLGFPKARYGSKSEAKTALKRMTHRNKAGIPIRRNAKIYKCAVCNLYHIGH